MKPSTKTQKIVSLVFKAVAVGMGVAVVVLNVLGSAPLQTQVLLLGIGLFALAVDSL